MFQGSAFVDFFNALKFGCGVLVNIVQNSQVYLQGGGGETQLDNSLGKAKESTKQPNQQKQQQQGRKAKNNQGA